MSALPRRVRLAAWATGALLALGASAGEHDGEHGHRHRASGDAGVEREHHGAGDAGAEPAPIPSGSLYQLDSRWTTREGVDLPLSALAGRVQVLAMVYTHCEHACPRIVSDMRRIRREIGGSGNDVGFVLVSLDPERDDPERLAEFAEQTGLGEGWTLLGAEEGPVRELAAALGVRYRRVGESDFLHSNLISVLDREGVVVHRQVGLGVDPARTVAAIRALLEDPPSDREGAGVPRASGPPD